MLRHAVIPSLLAAAYLASWAPGDEHGDRQPSTKAKGKTPAETVAGMKLPEGFKAQLAVGEPDVHQPIAFTIDERGRLWVAENYSYPNWAPTGNDRIVVFEDENADGAFEKRTVFYDKLNFVSGIEVGFGGVFVGSPPNLLFIPDRDRDDKPDAEPEVLLDGWGHHDTHETLNSFIWGPDGWLYGCHGVFTHSNVGKPGTPDAERTPMNAGVWRYHPTRKVFEVFAHGTSNPWGVDFDEYGECFITACVIPHAYHIVPGGRYQRQAGQHFNPHTYDDIKTIADHSHYAGGDWQKGRTGEATDTAGGGHAHAGAMIYLGDNFPAEYRGKLLMNNIHGNRINMDVLTPRGSTFTASHGPDFMLANDPWYRGLYLRSGPAGEVYASDWYDPLACHQQKPHDRTNGRIYRISYGDRPPERVDLSKLTDKQLVDLQLHDNEWHARTARRLLMERAAAGKAMEEVLRAVFEHRHHRHRLNEVERVRMVLTAFTIANHARDLRLPPVPPPNNPLDPGDTPYEIAWNVRMLAELGVLRPDVEISELFWVDLAGGSATIVRREVASALRRIPLTQRLATARVLLIGNAAVQDADDPMIPLLIWYGIEPLVAVEPALALALMDKSKMPRVNEFIVRRAAAEENGRDALADRLIKSSDANEAKMIVAQMRAALEPVARAKAPSAWPTMYEKLLASEDARVRDDARFLAARFGDPRVFPQLRAVIADANAKMPDRQAAIETLVTGGDQGGGAAFLGALDAPELRLRAIQGLAIAEHADAPGAILDRFVQLNGQEKAAAVATLSSRPGYAGKLVEAIGAGVVARSDVPVFAVRQMLAFDDPTVTKLIETHWGMIRQLSADKTEQMVKWKTLLNDKYLATADPRNGRAMFAQACAACHKLFDVGSDIGPDLTGSNRRDLDYVLANVLDPGAEIGRDYQLTVLTLADGRVVSGMIRGENDSAVTVQMATERTVVDKAQVANRVTLPQSMMPEGLLATMQDSDVRDLVAYLRSPRQVRLVGEGPAIDPTTGRVAGAIEGESLEVVKVTRGQVRKQEMGGFKADRWSGDAHLWWLDAQPGDVLTLAIPIQNAGRYAVSLALTMSRDYGVVQLGIDGRAVGDPIDLFSPPTEGRNDVVSTGPVAMGEHDLKPGSTLTVTITGANPGAEKRYMFAIDYLQLRSKGEAP